MQLFQGKPIGAGDCIDPFDRRRITFLGTNDETPSLVLRPASAGASGADLVWSRNDGLRGESGHIWLASADCTPRVAVSGASTFVSFLGSRQHPVLAVDRGGWTVRDLVPAPVEPARVAALLGTPHGPGQPPPIADRAPRSAIGRPVGGQ
jgi:hypothetical protein